MIGKPRSRQELNPSASGTGSATASTLAPASATLAAKESRFARTSLAIGTMSEPSPNTVATRSSPTSPRLVPVLSSRRQPAASSIGPSWGWMSILWSSKRFATSCRSHSSAKSVEHYLPPRGRLASSWIVTIV